MKLSIEQQKLADALMPHVAYVSPGTRFMIEQLIDRYWQPKPIDPPGDLARELLNIVLNFHDIPDEGQENILEAFWDYFAGRERPVCCIEGHADGCECHSGAKPKLQEF